MDSNVIDATNLFSSKPIVDSIVTAQDIKVFFKVLSKIKDISIDNSVVIELLDETISLTFNEEHISHEDLDIEEATMFVSQQKQSMFTVPVDWDCNQDHTVNATMLLRTLVKAFAENNEDVK